MIAAPMPSERVQRQIDRLLDEAAQAITRLDWTVVRDRAEAVLAADPENVDGREYLAMARRGLAATSTPEDVGATLAVARANPPDVVAQHAAPGHPEALEGPAAPPIPASFANGRYEVRRFLGEGGKKRVYLAHDTLLDRDVAFALIKTEGLDAAARTRITREAQAMGRLGDHPNIVTVYDIGDEPGQSGNPSTSSGRRLANGQGSVVAALAAAGGPGGPASQPYMVLPLLPGGGVEGLIERAPGHKLPLDRALKIATEVCHGLEFAHAKGIVHRDLKPGNVWLSQDGTAKIGD